MVSNLPANMLAEMKGQDRIYSVLELDLSSTLRFAQNPLASDSSGLYLPYLITGVIPVREADTVNFSFNTAKASAVIYDEGRVLQKELGGPSRKNIRGNAARWKLVSPFLESADHFTFFDAVITNYGMTSDRTYSFEMSPKLTEFDSVFNIPIHSKSFFPNILIADEDTDMNLVYGEHRSSGITGADGMITCTSINEADIWTVSLGRIEAVTSVYVDETKIASGDWTELLIARGRNNISTIRITTGAPAATAKVTVDVKGLTDDPSSADGTMISNPIEIVRNMVANFVYKDGTTSGVSAWADESTLPIATNVLNTARDFYKLRNLAASVLITSSSIPRTVISGIGKDWNAAPFFTLDNEFAMRPEDPSETDIYLGDDNHILDSNQHLLKFRSMETARQTPTTKLNVSFILNNSGGGFAKTVQVADKDITPELIENLQLTTSRAVEF